MGGSGGNLTSSEVVGKGKDMGSIKLFIVHKETDKNIATLLVDYIRKATGLKPDQIMCSSVAGCQIPAGGWIAGELKKSIKSSAHIIALCSYKSVESTWVIFELGASWVLSKSIVALVGPGVRKDKLPAPIMEHSAIHIQKDEALPRIVDAIKRMAQDIGVPFHHDHETTASLDKFIAKFRAKKPQRNNRKSEQRDNIANKIADAATMPIRPAEGGKVIASPASVTITPIRMANIKGLNLFAILSTITLNQPPTQGEYKIDYYVPLETVPLIQADGFADVEKAKRNGIEYNKYSCQVSERIWPGETKQILSQHSDYRLTYFVPKGRENDSVFYIDYELYLEDFAPVKGRINLSFD